ncbi:hypothetical protein [Anthocerotibacter panamensis]|uniref:hypothetical protein n=1 Tax=Anthocerotibacter panamensis TaxID=2857077 RepID=UPI001C402648|nr:hypothetical protein [Anthocerotibacter panamensis]
MTQVLETLAEAHDTSKVEILRRAIAVYNFLENETTTGNRKVVIAEGDRIIKEIVLT